MERALRKTNVGIVVSDKMDKTIVVAIRSLARYGPIRLSRAMHFFLTVSATTMNSSSHVLGTARPITS